MSNVYVNSGIGAQLVMVPESAYGVAPVSGANLSAPTINSAQTAIVPFEFDSEGLELKKTTVQGKGIHGGGLHNRAARRKLTNYETAGPVAMDLPTRYLNQLLMQMMGSGYASAQFVNGGSKLTQMGTTGVYQSVHGPGSLKGQSTCIQKGVPSVDGAAPSPFTYVGQKLQDWELSVATGALVKLALNWVGRNELAGPFPNGGASASGDPLNLATPALALFNEASNNDVFHFREATVLTGGVPSTVATTTAVTTPSMPASGVAVQNTTGALAAATITAGTITAVLVNGVQVGTTAGTYGVPANGTIGITYSVAPTWNWFLGFTTLTGASAAGNVKAASVKYAFKYDTTRFFLGSSGFWAEPIENDWRDIGGQLEVEWLNSGAMYNAFAADTPTALQLVFTGSVIGTSGTNTQLLSTLIPAIYLDGEPPKVGGPAVVTQKIPFTGLDDGINNAIQITYQTVDTV